MTRLRQALTILTMLILVACDRTLTTSVPSTTARESSPSPSTPTFGPCQLPVALSASPVQIGWLALPGGQFSPDASANGVRSSYGNVAWDSGIGKWLPTYPTWISPDGSAYIPDAQYLNEIVDANTGTILHKIAPGSYYWVAGWTSAGIYLLGGSGKNPVDGLWHVDPTTGVVNEVPGSAIRGGWSLVDESAAWASIDNSDSSTSFLRLDLATGDVRTEYTTQSSQWARLLGFAGSGVLALVHDGPNLASAIVIDPHGVTTTFALPKGLLGVWVGTLNPEAIQDGTTTLLSETGAIAAFDPVHGVQILDNSGRDFFLLGRCKPS